MAGNAKGAGYTCVVELEFVVELLLDYLFVKG